MEYWLPNHPILLAQAEVRMGGRNIAVVVLLTGLPQTAVAQSPIAIVSEIETGWTSNATDSAAGGEDFYVTHSHDMSLTAQTETLSLRGSLSISQTRFAVTSFEDDDEVAGAVEAQLTLAPGAQLRLGYGVTRSWVGDDLSIAGLVIPLHSAGTEHEYLAEFTLVGTDQQATVAVLADWTMPGDSMLAGLGLPPLRLTPEVGSVIGRVGWERALSPTMAVLTGMEAWFTLIPEDDQLTYFRAPADGARVAAGLRLVDGIVSLEGMGGVDLVWPKGFSELTRSLPYVSLTGSVAPMAGLTLAANATTGVELADPLDSVAGRTTAFELGATWQVAPDVSVQATLAEQRERGLFDEGLGRSVRVASLGVAYTVPERFKYGATLSWSEHVEPGESYDKTGIALSLSAEF